MMTEKQIEQMISERILELVEIKVALWPRDLARPMSPFNNARSVPPDEQAHRAAKAIVAALYDVGALKRD